MKTDRELLELAAKAAGIEIKVVIGDTFWTPDGLVWNPLASDGDALRLAVKCSIELYEGSSDGTPQSWAGWFVPFKRTKYLCEPHEGDPYAATRRVIVRAAAEIALATKETT